MFIAYEISRQLIVSLRPLVPVILASDRDLADQLKRAAQSVLLNLAEGQSSRMATGGSTTRSRKGVRTR